MEMKCVICLTIEVKAEDDIHQRLIEGMPVYLLIDELFGLKVDYQDRIQKQLPHKVCSNCMEDLATAYNFKCQLWNIQEQIDEWERKHEPGEVCSSWDLNSEFSDGSEMNMKCVICLNNEVKAEDDMRQRLIEGIPVYLLIDELFGLKIEVEDRLLRNLPHKVCSDCMEDLTTTHHLKCQLWKMQEWIEEWERKLELGEVPSSGIASNIPLEFNCLIDIKEEIVEEPKCPVESNSAAKSEPSAFAFDGAIDSKYKCVYRSCVYKFQDKKALEQHFVEVHLKHPNKHLYSCDICQKKHKTRRGIQRHMNDVHISGERFTCDICNEKFSYKKSLQRHITSQHLKISFPCKVCHKHFVDRRSRYNHEYHAHKEKELIECHICQKRINGAWNLRNHFSTHFSQYKAKIECEICKKTFKDERNLKRHHQFVHNAVKNISCDICQKRFKRPVELRMHQVSHSEERNFSCEFCPKKFKTLQELQRHRNHVHINPEASYQCDICDKKLKTLRSLRRHKEVHLKRLKESELVSVQVNNIKDEVIEKHDNSHFDHRESLVDSKLHLDKSLICKSPSKGLFNDPSYSGYKCKKSNNSFQDKKSLDLEQHCAQTHLKRSHTFSCKSCSEKFTRIRELRLHVAKVHEIKQKYTCDVCNKNFKNNKNLRRHMEGHMKDIFACDACPLKFRRANQLEAHKIIHLEDKYECDICHKRFKYDAHLKEHRATHFSENLDDHDRPFSCKVCQKNFKTAQNLWKHRYLHRQKNNIECHICQKKFKSWYIKEHLETHANDQLSCDLCQKIFKSKRSIERHMNVEHLKLLNFSCQICEKKFETKGKLWYHKNVHLEAIFSCDVCQKKFKKETELKVHKETHLEDNPYKCNICGKQAQNASSLRKHIIIMHIQEYKFACSICPKKYKQSYELKKHQAAHTENTKQS